MKNNPAGWYRNPDDRRQHGYWDGLAWVEPPDDDLVDADPAQADPSENPSESSDSDYSD